jgi:hypothetical protein
VGFGSGLAALAGALALAGCGPGDDDPGAGGVTVGEARALDEAAAMLDAQRLPDGVLQDVASESQAPAGPATAESDQASGPE